LGQAAGHPGIDGGVDLAVDCEVFEHVVVAAFVGAAEKFHDVADGEFFFRFDGKGQFFGVELKIQRGSEAAENPEFADVEGFATAVGLPEFEGFAAVGIVPAHFFGE